jgi:hypothetical protein
VQDLLKASESELKEWVATQSVETLQKTLGAIDREIRGAMLTGGQPRGTSSATNVDLARMALRIAEIGHKRLLVAAWRMLAYSLNADEEFEQSLHYYALAIPGLDSLGELPLAARTRLGYLDALKETGNYGEAPSSRRGRKVVF